jgi:hypothetical protein
LHRLKIDEDVIIRVKSSTGMTEMHYIVVGKTEIIRSETISDLSERQEVEFSFRATDAMSPQSNVLIYFVHSTGEIIFDQLELSFSRKLKTDVSLSYLSY